MLFRSPKDEVELKNMMFTAVRSGRGPFIIRYPRGYGEGLDWRNADFEEVEPGRGELVLDGEGIAVIAAGPFVYRASEAAARYREATGKNICVYNIRYIKPLDVSVIDEAAKKSHTIITVEDGCASGGLHGAVAEYVAEHNLPVRVTAIGIPDKFISQGSQKELRAECGLDEGGIFDAISEIMQKNDKKD